jgi:hypothetical protein
VLKRLKEWDLPQRKSDAGNKIFSLTGIDAKLSAGRNLNAVSALPDDNENRRAWTVRGCGRQPEKRVEAKALFLFGFAVTP